MKIKVIVRDNKTLVLAEDAKKDDIIDLTELGTIDFDLIEKVISENKDKVYNEKLNALKSQFESDKKALVANEESKAKDALNALNKRIYELENELKNKEKDLTSKYEIKLQQTIHDGANKTKDVEVRYDKELDSLKNENKALREQQNLLIEKVRSDKDKELAELKASLTKELSSQKETASLELNKLQSLLDKKVNEQQVALLNQEKEISNKYEGKISELNEVIKTKDNAINELTFQKSIKNVKQTGEDLESWCDNEVTSYMQNGLFNCDWIKDNKVIKEVDEAKGSKADYILKIYANDNRNETELLTSICMDMKDENPESKNKIKNEKYYPALDKNRNKKNCKYAVLVSNLEREKNNDLPIFKVRDYEDMYVVRPEYLMVFINLVVSLNVKFKDLLLKAKKEDELFIESKELMDEFEKLKNTYLEKPLEVLNKQVEEINKQSNNIINAAEKIKEANRNIINNYIEEIQKKLERFNVKKLMKKLDKINEKEDF